jgi:hypothetical protein
VTRRRPPYRLATALCALLLACSAPTPSAARTSVAGGLLVVETGADTGVGITAALHDDTVVCENSDPDAPPIGWLLYEREEERRDYGVYGLGLAKNPMHAPRPLTGQGIHWPDKDHIDGLAHLLQRAVSEDEARSLVESHGERWFRPGLRAFFVLPGKPPDAHSIPGAEGAIAALRIVELDR